MKTTLEIPDDLFRKAKAMAALEGIKLKDFVAESLQMRVETRQQTARKTKGQLKPPTMHGGVVKSAVREAAHSGETKLPLLRPGKRPPAASEEQEIYADDEAGATARLPSVHDLMKDCCGMFDSGVGDLSTNPKHMEGFGRDSMGDR
jgi:hypothetical protein